VDKLRDRLARLEPRRATAGAEPSAARPASPVGPETTT
jgi:hypothetical protein